MGGQGTREDSPDPRTGGQRDRDRILYSDYFRRLSGVTQVAASREVSLFHNRLTHSLEVAQLARRIAERVTQDDEEARAEIDPDIVEAAALAHDLGHPPFGHCAEKELDRLVSEQKLQDGFEGNAQSFRIVTKLAQRAEEHPGLDLTRASLQALTKYPWPRGTGGDHHRKYGHFYPETDDFAWSRQGRVDPATRTPEAEIMDWADDVAYALHDVEDFYRAGLIPLDRLTHAESSEWDDFLAYAFDRLKVPNEVQPDYLQVADDLHQELPTEPWHAQRSRGLFERFVPAKINIFTSALRWERGRVLVDPHATMEVALLKQLTWRYVIEAPALAGQQEGQRAIVRSLFRYYADQIADETSRRALPSIIQAYLGNDELTAQHDRDGLVARVACDAVAGLTESQAVALHKRIIGVDTGSIFEPINA